MKPQIQLRRPWLGLRNAHLTPALVIATTESCHAYVIHTVPDWKFGCMSVYSLAQYTLLRGFCWMSACLACSSCDEVRLSMCGKPSFRAAISKFVDAPFHSEILPL